MSGGGALVGRAKYDIGQHIAIGFWGTWIGIKSLNTEVVIGGLATYFFHKIGWLNSSSSSSIGGLDEDGDSK